MLSSRLVLLLLLGICLPSILAARNSPHKAEVEDNEFAEFEDLDEEEEDDEFIAVETEEDVEEDGNEFEEVMSEDEEDVAERDEFMDDQDDTMEDEDEFDHFQDAEEFENFEDRPAKGKGKDSPDLEITKVPLHLRNSWDSYYLELLMLAGVAAYLLNYMNGRSKNQRLASAWFNSHKELLEANFALVGDDVQKELQPELSKQSENRYCLWCSGRVFCEGMLVELKFLKRQDLLSVISRTMHPAADEIKITVTLDVDAMDSYVLFVGAKKVANRMYKDMQDLGQYCTDKRGGDKYGLPASTLVLAEIGEVVNGLFDTKVLNCLTSHDNMFDYIHVSDQFSGPKPAAEDEQPTTQPPIQKVLICNFKVPGNGRSSKSDVEDMLPMMKMVIYLIDKIKRFRLSKEGKMKAERARGKVADSYVKLAHAQRQEQAQLRREDKRRAEKERLLNEDDPDKARRLEDKQYKKDMRRRNNPSMKQIKVRGT